MMVIDKKVYVQWCVGARAAKKCSKWWINKVANKINHQANKWTSEQQQQNLSHKRLLSIWIEMVNTQAIVSDCCILGLFHND